jgi:ligand-binding SRPBCC domain-containing protein
LEVQYPLLWRHVHAFNGTGGGTSIRTLLEAFAKQ